MKIVFLVCVVATAAWAAPSLVGDTLHLPEDHDGTMTSEKKTRTFGSLSGGMNGIQTGGHVAGIDRVHPVQVVPVIMSPIQSGLRHSPFMERDHKEPVKPDKPHHDEEIQESTKMQGTAQSSNLANKQVMESGENFAPEEDNNVKAKVLVKEETNQITNDNDISSSDISVKSESKKGNTSSIKLANDMMNSTNTANKEIVKSMKTGLTKIQNDATMNTKMDTEKGTMLTMEAEKSETKNIKNTIPKAKVMLTPVLFEDLRDGFTQNDIELNDMTAISEDMENVQSTATVKSAAYINKRMMDILDRMFASPNNEGEMSVFSDISSRGSYGNYGSPSGDSGLWFGSSQGNGVLAESLAPVYGVFPHTYSGGSAIPLLMICSPSVVQGKMATHHGGYVEPSYRMGSGKELNQ